MHDRGSNPFALNAAPGLLGATGGYRRKRRRCAFSLIELMIALTILGLALLLGMVIYGAQGEKAGIVVPGVLLLAFGAYLLVLRLFRGETRKSRRFLDDLFSS